MPAFTERPHLFKALFGFAVAVAVVSMVAGAVTVPAIPAWYHHLALPTWTPPDAVFGPVWTALYVIMALAAWGVWRTPDSASRRLGLGLWWLQLALNFAWPPLFFGLHGIGLALVDIILLAGSLAATITVFRRVVPFTAWMLAPYMAWVLYAGGLNAAVWSMNG